MTKPRILLHPGFPKCGSTSLQANVFACHPELRYLSHHSAPGDGFRDAPETAEFHAAVRDLRDGSTARIEELWRTHMVPGCDPGRLNVISDETFLNNEGSVEEIARLLHRLVGEAHVLIVVRDQSEILRSLYDMYPWLKGDPDRRYLPFSTWLERTLERAGTNICGSLRFADTLALYRDVFGAEAVTVISMTRLFGDPSAQAELCARLGIDAAEFARLIARPPANSASDHSTKKLVRRVLGPIRGSAFLSPAQIRSVRKVLGVFVRNGPTRVTPEDSARIEAHFAGHRIGDLAMSAGKGAIL